MRIHIFSLYCIRHLVNDYFVFHCLGDRLKSDLGKTNSSVSQITSELPEQASDPPNFLTNETLTPDSNHSELSATNDFSSKTDIILTLPLKCVANNAENSATYGIKRKNGDDDSLKLKIIRISESTQSVDSKFHNEVENSSKRSNCPESALDVQDSSHGNMQLEPEWIDEALNEDMQCLTESNPSVSS